MGKGGITKKSREPSIHSRAARRATSPSIDTDKSLKNVKAPPESINHRPSILAIHHGAGVSKKAKKGRNTSAKARRRHERAQDRAAAVMERTELKVVRSKGQARAIHSRRKAWEDVNGEIPQSHNTNAAKKPEANKQSSEVEGDEGGVPELDDEMGEAEGEAGGKATAAAQLHSDPPPQTMEEDEII